MLYKDFPRLQLGSGREIAPVRVAWAQYGAPPARARKIHLLLHGITSSPQAFLGDPEPALDAGWFRAWADGVFDLDRDCILAPNALGSCFGSSAPQGAGTAEFPAFTIEDTVAFYAQWLRWLGVPALDGVIGYSYGGYQAFQWALAPPVQTGKVVVLASAPKGNGSDADVHALSGLAAKLDTNDADAWQAWRSQRLDTLRRYGHADWLAARGEPVELALETAADLWIAEFSPWSLACLRQAAVHFDVREPLCGKVDGVPILWMVNRGDKLFPANDLAVSSRARIQRATVQGRFGHSSPMLEPELWMPTVRQFLCMA